MTANLQMLQPLSWRFACPVLLSILGNMLGGIPREIIHLGLLWGKREKETDRKEREVTRAGDQEGYRKKQARDRERKKER